MKRVILFLFLSILFVGSLIADEYTIFLGDAIMAHTQYGWSNILTI